MAIDLGQFNNCTKAELYELNQFICARIKAMNRASCAQATQSLYAGQKAYFICSSGKYAGVRIEGTITKVNNKNVAFASPVYGNWRVTATSVHPIV